ncbi:MAG: entericidin, EcnA/B family [Gemmobacter sp.]
MRMILLAATLALSACNTIAGLGEDISSGARTVQRAF